jgi:hypothetical protein
LDARSPAAVAADAIALAFFCVNIHAFITTLYHAACLDCSAGVVGLVFYGRSSGMPSQRPFHESIRKYEIFREDPGKGPMWIETAVGLEQAKQRVVRLHAEAPADYRLFDAHSGVFLEFRAAASA